MRIVFDVTVGIDVESYAEAGIALDQITEAVKRVTGEKGEYDVANFRARHRAIRQRPWEADKQAEIAEQKMMLDPTVPMSIPEGPDPDR